MRKPFTVLGILCGLAAPALPLSAQQLGPFTHADTLRGSNGPARAWWDAAFYDLHVRVSPADSSVAGWNAITYRVRQPGREMQIDLQTPLQVDSMVQDGRRLEYRRDGNAFFARLSSVQRAGTVGTVTVYYHGRPQVAANPPWDGGVVWARDSLGHPYIATANEGTGASVWWPLKDTDADEPDSQRIAITVPDSLFEVSNGRLRSVTPNPDGTATFEWFVSEPINAYDVAIDAGKYTHFGGIYYGEDGPLTLDYWPLEYHLEAARKQFQQVEPMLKCFEHWFGPFPWYRDGYKLVETPYLGMEHQSNVAYGNHFLNGYLGRDLSGTGHGLSWDFIIVHESAHEWFGNSITAADIADNWIHEGFANYAEALYTECQQGKAAGAAYARGLRARIRNDRPIIAPYGVNQEGSGDEYYKGGNLLHTLRQIVDDDEKWRSILRGLGTEFRHRIVTTADIEHYISQKAGVDLSKVFDEYLRTTMVPVFQYRLTGSSLAYRWANVVPGFDMPVKVTVADSTYAFIHPTTAWQTSTVNVTAPGDFHVDPDFYVETRDLTAADAAAPGAR